MSFNILSRKERERIRRQKEILDVSLELFVEKGYSKVSMQEIATKSEFALGTLYKFFSSKENLYKKLISEKADEYYTAFNNVFTKQLTVLETIKLYINSKVEFFIDNVAALKLYLSESRGVSLNVKVGLEKEIRNKFTDIENLLIEVIETGIEEKVLHNRNASTMAMALEGATNSVITKWIESVREEGNSETELIQEVDNIIEIFLNGVAVKVK